MFINFKLFYNDYYNDFTVKNPSPQYTVADGFWRYVLPKLVIVGDNAIIDKMERHIIEGHISGDKL